MVTLKALSNMGLLHSVDKEKALLWGHGLNQFTDADIESGLLKAADFDDGMLTLPKFRAMCKKEARAPYHSIHQALEAPKERYCTPEENAVHLKQLRKELFG